MFLPWHMQLATTVHIGNKIPAEYNLTAKRQGGIMPLKVTGRSVVRKDFLGGLLRSYQRVA